MACSWDTWAQYALVAGKHTAAHHAGVYGLDGSCWGATDDLARNIPKDFFVNVGSIMASAGGKLKYNDKSYITIRFDPNRILAKCGASGITICKGIQSYVVAMYDDESVQPPNNCLGASLTCDKLKESGY